MTFNATHIITIHHTSGDKATEHVPVMESEGSLYTREEWASEVAADWTLSDNGDVLFQGGVPAVREYRCERVDQRWYRICNSQSGHNFGIFAGVSEEDSLAAMREQAGAAPDADDLDVEAHELVGAVVLDALRADELTDAGLEACHYTTPIEEGRESIDRWTAEEIAESDPGLLYVRPATQG